MIPDLKELVTRYSPDVMVLRCLCPCPLKCLLPPRASPAFCSGVAPMQIRIQTQTAGAAIYPSPQYVDGEWSYDSEHWQTKPFLAWLFNDSPVRMAAARALLDRSLLCSLAGACA